MSRFFLKPPLDMLGEPLLGLADMTAEVSWSEDHGSEGIWEMLETGTMVL